MSEETQTAEQHIDTSLIPEVVIGEKILFHGSKSSGIERFNKAEETTIGQGLYLTSDPDSARGYAARRSKTDTSAIPTVYQVGIENVRMADLRTLEGVKPFASMLLTKLEERSRSNKLKWYEEETIRRTIESIKSNTYKSLKDITWNHQGIVTSLLQEQGFDGLIAIEGGEGEEITEHDSYVIFDPSKVQIKSVKSAS